jgi:ParB family transcriptional regulator, chromosome partitioning protein
METTSVETTSTTIEQLAQDVPEQFIPVSMIDADFNYRRRFKPGPMQQLADNIKAVGGLIYPVILRIKDDGRYQLLVGGRRLRAFIVVYGDESKIKAKVLQVTDELAVALMMSENGAREDPSIIEDAEGAARMLGLCNGDRDEAAARLGWDRKKFDRRVAVMYATQKARDAYLDDHIGVGHVEILAAFRKEVQDRIIDKCRAGESRWPTLDELKQLGEGALRSLENAIFDRAECNGCKHNTGYQQAMFDNAFEGSRCSNGECYEKKTFAVLDVRKAKLEEEYQVVRILKRGENHTVIALRADGDDGVGQEQANACRQCGDFGAGVSGLPDALGKVFRDVCFNKTCHDQKVEASRKAKRDASRAAHDADQERIQSEAGTAAAAEPKADTTDRPSGKPASSAKASTPAATSVNSIRPVVKEYREEIWRAVFRRAAKKLPVMASRSLLAAILIHRPSHADNHAAISAINKALGEETFGTGNRTDRVLTTLLKLDQTKLAVVFNQLAAHVTKDMPIADLVALLKALGVRIEDWWKVNEDYFKLLTKVELDAVCKEIGLDKVAGKTYTSLANGSKKDFVEAMLKQDGFKYEGAVPKMMRWN